MLKRMFPWIYKYLNTPVKEYKCSSCDESYVFMFDGKSHECDQYLVTKKAVREVLREVLEEMGFEKVK